MSIETLAKQIEASEAKTDRLREKLELLLKQKYGRDDLYVTIVSDGLSIMFEDEGHTGVRMGDFIEKSKKPDFDIFNITTYL